MGTLNPIGDNIVVEILSNNTLDDEATVKRLEAIGIKAAAPDKDKVQGYPTRGRVIALGPKVAGMLPNELLIGQTIVYDERHPKGFKFAGKKLLSIKPQQVQATL